MDVGFRTPLLDFFRRGDVARDIRLLAAQGALAPRAHEQLGLLMGLVSDSDQEIARAAETTLQVIPRGSLQAFLARPDVSVEMREFFAARGIEPAAIPAEDASAPILDTDSDPEPEAEPLPTGQPEEDDQDRSTLARIGAMSIAERVKLAMRGSREERAILIRDSNKIVGVAVLSSPKLSEVEVASIARMASLSEELLRIIAQTRAWMKSYPVCVALAKNPKTPVALSMNLLSRLNEKDLKTLVTDRNIPDVLRFAAKKKMKGEQ